MQIAAEERTKAAVALRHTLNRCIDASD
jgi:hypothetical protein